MFQLTKKFKFEASHRLPEYNGPCERLHGHTFHGEVVVSGWELKNSGSQAGMLIDYAEIKKVISPVIDEYLDHHHLNDVIENPTSENIAKWLWKQWQPGFALKGVKLAKIVIEETESSRCEYYE